MPEAAMSQAYLSSEAAASKETTEPEIGRMLKRYLRADLRPDFRQHLHLRLQDPFAKGANGGFKPSTLCVGLGALWLVTLVGFVYFNFMRA